MSQHDVRVPKDDTVGDVLEALRKQLPEDKRPAALRLLEVFYSKIYKVRQPAAFLHPPNIHYAPCVVTLLPHKNMCRKFTVGMWRLPGWSGNRLCCWGLCISCEVLLIAFQSYDAQRQLY